ncbi:hypothetical protein [Streptomyces sp. B5E4]|uniref:hypothetical protein n=1 Tax=Streptomyces sp. B5E4 TaxID=3153568 RepID=UPI00325EAD3E
MPDKKEQEPTTLGSNRPAPPKDEATDVNEPIKTVESPKKDDDSEGPVKPLGSNRP